MTTPDPNDTIMTAVLDGIASGTLFGRPVIISPIDGTPPPDAVVLWNDKAGEGICIQPLHTALDRAALARRMERVRKEQTERNKS